ncbi:AMP-binding protein [Neoactinobaculum massilliense]|uniref:AMP-binding protein n=1 Tax=Neoactinobaculum massilliense TaxID=2364794 RepID=UPI000F541204|nr:AMP-binding protein [Neoactinobaculum massilliense]
MRNGAEDPGTSEDSAARSHGDSEGGTRDDVVAPHSTGAAPRDRVVHAAPLVIRCGEADDADRVAEAVRRSLRAYRAGEPFPPIFPVGPETDPASASAEVAALGYPAGTALLMRTSGSTTGTGKIVAHGWDSVLASGRATAAALRGPGAWTGHLPLFHIAGFQTIVRSAVAGAPTRMIDASAESLAAWLREMADQPHRYVSLVPTQVIRALEDPALLRLLAGTTILVGGQAITPATLRAARAAGLEVVTSYGMTETAGGCVYNGRPIGDVQISLDAAGRISLRGSVVARGYLGGMDPDAFLPTTPRTHVTKDVGRLVGARESAPVAGAGGSAGVGHAPESLQVVELAGGTEPGGARLEVLGRVDDAINTRGLTVMPALIEAALAELGVPDATVVGVPDAESGEAVVAVTPGPVDGPALHRAVKARLGAGWAPARFVVRAELDPAWRDAWPLTDSGKVDRRQVAKAARKLG